MSTMITCIILYWFGNTFGAFMVKGFAITLFLGVVVSLFSSVTVTRTFLTQLVNNNMMKGVTLYGGKMINIISKRYWFFLISAIVIVPGIISLIAFGLKPSTDFQPGSTVTINFKPQVSESDLRQAMTAAGYPDATIQLASKGTSWVIILSVFRKLRVLRNPH